MITRTRSSQDYHSAGYFELFVFMPTEKTTIQKSLQSKVTESPLTSSNKKSYIEWLPLTVAIAYFVFNLVVVNPSGNFPLNDDYVYGLAVSNFLDTGNLQLFASGSACFLHIALGALASFIFGFSFEVLRSLNLALGFVSLISVFLIARELKVDRVTAGFASCLYAVNPITTNLQFTYMTDISAAAFFSIYFLFLLKAINKNNSPKHLVVSGLFLTAAILVRQSYVIFVIPNLVLLTINYLKKQLWAKAVIALVILPVLSMVLSDRLMESTSSMVYAYNYHKEALISYLSYLSKAPLALAKIFTYQVSHVLAYMGLFTAPLLIACLPKLVSKVNFKNPGYIHLASITIVLVFCFDYFINGIGLLSLPNIWRLDHLGASGLIGQIALQASPFLANSTTWIALVGLTALSALLFSLTNHCIKDRGPISTIEPTKLCKTISILILATAVVFVTINTSLRHYDRYLIDALIPVLALTSLALSYFRVKPLLIPALILIGIQASITTIEQERYMAWNRARWLAIEYLEKISIPSRDIDGGAEYNFYRNISLWHKFKISNGVHELDKRHKGSQYSSALRWWPVDSEDKYVISFKNIDGYKQIKTIPIDSFWKSNSDHIKILEKTFEKTEEITGGAK